MIQTVDSFDQSLIFLLSHVIQSPSKTRIRKRVLHLATRFLKAMKPFGAYAGLVSSSDGEQSDFSCSGEVIVMLGMSSFAAPIAGYTEFRLISSGFTGFDERIRLKRNLSFPCKPFEINCKTWNIQSRIFVDILICIVIILRIVTSKLWPLIRATISAAF